MYYGFGHGLCPGFGWWGMGLGIIGHLAFTILIIIAAIWLFRKFFHANRQETRFDSLEILKQRYAKGEISSAQYQQMKNELE